MAETAAVPHVQDAHGTHCQACHPPISSTLGSRLTISHLVKQRLPLRDSLAQVRNRLARMAAKNRDQPRRSLSRLHPGQVVCFVQRAYLPSRG
jgi:hypothetical protein